MLEDHPRTCFSDDRINPRSWGLRITMVIKHLLNGTILQVVSKRWEACPGVMGLLGDDEKAGFWYMIPCLI